MRLHIAIECIMCTKYQTTTTDSLTDIGRHNIVVAGSGLGHTRHLETLQQMTDERHAVLNGQTVFRGANAHLEEPLAA